MAGKLIFGR